MKKYFVMWRAPSERGWRVLESRRYVRALFDFWESCDRVSELRREGWSAYAYDVVTGRLVTL